MALACGKLVEFERIEAELEDMVQVGHRTKARTAVL